MARGIKVPTGARCMRKIEGPTTADIGNEEGTIASVTMWDGHYSQGYKSDYEQVYTRWLMIEVREPSQKPLRYTFRFSGDRRIAACEAQWADIIQGIDAQVTDYRAAFVAV